MAENKPVTERPMAAHELVSRQERLANDAFESFNFGEGLTVAGFDGWQNETFDGKDDWTRVVYVECDEDAPDADSHKVSFHAAFARGTAILNEAYAYWCENGAEIGAPGGKSRAENKPVTERPLAATGLTSYRYQGFYGWIMIGARDNADAFREASRSTRDRLQPERLEIWSPDEERYIQALKPVFETQTNADGICAKIFELDEDFKVVAYDEKNEVRPGLCLWASSLSSAKEYANQFGEPKITKTQRSRRP